VSYVQNHLGRQKQSGYPRALADYLADRFDFWDQTMADFGCGLGGYTRALDRRVTVVGFDIEPVRIGESCLGGPIPSVVLDLTKQRWLGNLFDFGFSKSVLEHIVDPIPFLENIKAAIKPGGQLILFVPDWTTGYKTFYDDYTHVRPYTLKSLYEVGAAVFDDVKVERFWQVPFAWKHPTLFKAFRWLRWFMPRGDLRNRMTVAALLLTARV
jgi:SAM-dependent methyltransferase